MEEVKTLYETDYQLWLAQTLKKLRLGDFENIDTENLIEEVESLGRSDRHAVSSYLMRLCEHLLKLKHWETEREMCFRGWNLEITNFRIQIQEQLETSPSLKTFLQENFLKQYTNGRKLFLKATDLDSSLIPEQPCFTLEQALDEDWLPWEHKSTSNH
ncbi:hypothetical protein CSQ79_13025 [Gloeocapsopsis sp. IPPAS B-1203]|nr:hypothetical protein CSQ79_13025 [Gloeocapsopsis sp. IPPAS B-1203]